VRVERIERISNASALAFARNGHVWPELSALARRIIARLLDPEEGPMVGERTRRVVLIVVGLLFLAMIYPGVMFFSREPAIPMIMSLYVTLGVFLLLAARNPAAHRSLIAFAGWANVAHAGVMALQEYWHVIQPRELVGVVGFGIIGLALIALAPAKDGVKAVSRANAA
jgi:succinate-acetate transporter protein